jgi:excisionase family DNA binding protein
MGTTKDAAPTEPTTALSVEETAQITKQSVPTIRRLIRCGELPHCRVGRRVVVLEEDVFRFLRARRVFAVDRPGSGTLR